MARATGFEVWQEYTSAADRELEVTQWLAVICDAVGSAVYAGLTLLGVQLALLWTGTVVTEYLFDWPGIGQLLI